MSEEYPDDGVVDETQSADKAGGKAMLPSWNPDTDREDRITYEPDTGVVPLEDRQSKCVCEGEWVESLPVISTAVRSADIRHYHDEMWVLATMADLAVLFDWWLRARLFDGEFVRVVDLPKDVDVSEYERPLNYRPSSDDRPAGSYESDIDEEAP